MSVSAKTWTTTVARSGSGSDATLVEQIPMRASARRASMKGTELRSLDEPKAPTGV
jgi:hypothetical protein